MESNSEDLYKKAMDWWNNLENDEVIDVYKKTDNFRLGRWR